MESKFTFREKLRYNFENNLSKGTIALIKWLGIFSILVMIIGGILISTLGITQDPTEEKLGFWEAFWQSLVRTLDSGTFGGDTGWGFRMVMLFVTIGGVFIVSALIGVLNSGLEDTITEIRKGRSKVVESGHTLILGWTPTIINIISELLKANENQKSARIVIMSERDKVEMEDDIRMSFPKTGNTKIICRTGSSLSLLDLSITNFNEAKSIIILSPEAENADTFTVKSVLAITNNPQRKKEKFHIVAEIRNEENMEAANLVGGDEACYVQSHDLIARITAQTCRQSGLSIIYTEMLDYGGDEIYFKEEKALKGKIYKDAIFKYEKSAIMGLMKADGSVLINPPMGQLIEEGDQVIAISEDDDTVVLSDNTDYKVNDSAFSENVKMPASKERNLVLGWNEKGRRIIDELDNYVLKGSEVLVVSDDESIEDEVKKLGQKLKNLEISFKAANITNREALDSLNIPTYQQIIVLGNQSIDVQEADAKTLITLLHLRNISEQSNIDFNIVSEMFDVQNRELAQITKADDFIVSDNIISLMITQLSENKNLKKVFDILFTAEGSEIYLKPIVEYVKPGSEINFYTLMEAASKKAETALGYKLDNDKDNPEEQFGVHLNPKKSDTFVVGPKDKIIVLSED